MDLFWKSILLALIAATLSPLLQKEFRTLFTAAAVTMGALLFLSILKPILSFLQDMGSAANIQSASAALLLKALAIGIGAEIGALVCTDSGNASLGKMIQLSGTAAILSLSLPLLNGVLTLIRQLLGA